MILNATTEYVRIVGTFSCWKVAVTGVKFNHFLLPGTEVLGTNLPAIQKDIFQSKAHVLPRVTNLSNLRVMYHAAGLSYLRPTSTIVFFCMDS